MNIQIHLGGKGRTRLKEMRMSPAEILLISQTRSPSRSPPKAKTNGKSGQEAAQKRTPCDGGKKKEEDFFFKVSQNEFVTWKYFHQASFNKFKLSKFPETYFVKTQKSTAANYKQWITSFVLNLAGAHWVHIVLPQNILSGIQVWGFEANYMSNWILHCNENVLPRTHRCNIF